MRDPREITVAGEARSARPARRRAADRAASMPGWRTVLGAAIAGTFHVCRRNPGTMAGGVVALAAVAMVSLNALGFQAGRHPAPILPKVAIRQDSVSTMIAPDKAAAAKTTEPVLTSGKPRETRTVDGKPARDAIADLIRSEDTTASVTPKAQDIKGQVQKPQPSVTQAQKALAKLGYGPLKADGLMGTGTRAAIEKFERDRKLPVKGEAAGRTLRELSARAGLPPA